MNIEDLFGLAVRLAGLTFVMFGVFGLIHVAAALTGLSIPGRYPPGGRAYSQRALEAAAALERRCPLEAQLFWTDHAMVCAGHPRQRGRSEAAWPPGAP